MRKLLFAGVIAAVTLPVAFSDSAAACGYGYYGYYGYAAPRVYGYYSVPRVYGYTYYAPRWRFYGARVYGWGPRWGYRRW